MDNRVRLAMEANRKYVQNGLNRRKVEGELDAFEAAMIRRCNEKHFEACMQSRADEAISHSRELSMSRIAERAERREKAKQNRKDIALACLILFAVSAVMLQLATWKALPLWVSITYIILGVFVLVSYILCPRDFPTD